jgi:hypothetical protein
MISRSRESTPIGATKNNWNRNFRRAMTKGDALKTNGDIGISGPLLL